MPLPQFVEEELVGHDLRVEEVLAFAHREVRQLGREGAGDVASLDEVHDLLSRGRQ